MTATLLTFLLVLSPLQARLEAIAASFKGQVAMYAKNLTTGETAGIRRDQRVRTASVIKVPILVEAFYEIKEGKLRLDQKVRAVGKDRVGGSGILSELSPELDITLEDALKLMIELSDNSATNIVLNLVTPEAVTARMASLGLSNTRSFKKIFQPAGHPSAESAQFGIGCTTPEEMGRLLELIERREAVDAPSSEKMLAYLKKQQDWNNMPRELAGRKVEFAMKSGALDDLRNDVGIMYTPAGPLVVAFFCDRSADQRWSPDNAASVTIGKLARAVYDAWAGAVPAAPAAGKEDTPRAGPDSAPPGAKRVAVP